MKPEYDFSTGKRGRFYRANAKLHLPRSPQPHDWAVRQGSISEFMARETDRTLRAYKAQPNRATAQANLERDAAQGGYAHRQILELVQNSADAIANSVNEGTILVRLTDNYLYCADDGKPIEEDGVKALMFFFMSNNTSIVDTGRFGLGFRCVLGVTDAPEFFSHTGSFRFDRKRASECISKVATADRSPVFSIPFSLDVDSEMERDADLRELAAWASNVVRLPLKSGARPDLARQIRTFPPEFLLFVDHVRHLILEDGEDSRSLSVRRSENDLVLDVDGVASRWKCPRLTLMASSTIRFVLDGTSHVPFTCRC